MQKYRLVLVPRKDVRGGFYGMTQKCAAIARDYLVHPNAVIPHITLVSFKIEEDKLPEIWDKIKDYKQVPITVSDFEFLQERELNFAQLNVEKTPELMDVRSEAIAVVNALGGEFSDRFLHTFNPHISLFDSDKSIKLMEDCIDNFFLIDNKDFKFDIAIGLSEGPGAVKQLLFK